MLGNWLKPVQILWDAQCWHPNNIFKLFVYSLYVLKSKKPGGTLTSQVSQVRIFVKSLFQKYLEIKYL
jgi:hypothetical protein